MGFAFVKIWLLSRLFLSTAGLLLLLALAIMFNWVNSHQHVRNGLITAVDWVDTLRDWGKQIEQTADNVNQAFQQAQKDLQRDKN